MAFQNVVVVGAAGKIGAPLVKGLASSVEPKFNVTALARNTSNYQPPQDIDTSRLKVAKVDFSDHTALVDSLRGQDVLILVLTAGPELLPTSITLIDAAVAAGVKRIIPSDFGNDKSELLEQIFKGKEAVDAKLEELAKENKITYTSIRNGPWFDIALEVAFAINLAEKKATIFDDGNQYINTTTRASVIKAIITILSKPSAFTNQIVHIHDFHVSQNEVLAAVEQVTGETLAVERVDLKEMGNKAVAALQRGEFSMPNFFGALRMTIWGDDKTASWDVKDDSERAGLDAVDLVETIQKVASGQLTL